MRYYDLYESPYGQILLVANDEGLAGVYFDGQKYVPEPDRRWQRDARHATLEQAKRELTEYFGGERRQFDTVLAPEGTAFQRAVWNAISTVGFGETITYGELARRAGYPGSARAAGAATGRNPIGIIVPCHRIVGSNGSLTGYAGGLSRKRALLALESGKPDLLSTPTRPPVTRGATAPSPADYLIARCHAPARRLRAGFPAAAPAVRAEGASLMPHPTSNAARNGPLWPRNAEQENCSSSGQRSS